MSVFFPAASVCHCCEFVFPYCCCKCVCLSAFVLIANVFVLAACVFILPVTVFVPAESVYVCRECVQPCCKCVRPCLECVCPCCEHVIWDQLSVVISSPARFVSRSLPAATEAYLKHPLVLSDYPIPIQT